MTYHKMTYQNNTQHEDIAMLLDYLKNKWDFFFGHSNHPKPLSDINHPKPKPEPNSAHSKPFCTKCGYYSKSKDQALQNLQKHIKNNVCHQPRANRLIHPDFQGTIAIVEKPFCTTCGFYSKSTTSSNQRLQKHIQSNSCHKPRANRLIHPDFVNQQNNKAQAHNKLSNPKPEPNSEAWLDPHCPTCGMHSNHKKAAERRKKVKRHIRNNGCFSKSAAGRSNQRIHPDFQHLHNNNEQQEILMQNLTKLQKLEITKVDEMYFQRLIKKQIQIAIDDRILINLPLRVQKKLVGLIWEDRLSDIYDDLQTGKYENLINELMLK